MCADNAADKQEFGRYQLIEKIAVGGMAEVWKAKVSGVHGFEKFVAVKKILTQYSSDPSFVQMFIDEAKLSVLLNHANIVQVLDLGQVSNNYFIAMEYVNGKNIRAIQRTLEKRKERLDIADALYVAQEVLAALDYAHRRKGPDGQPLHLIHRDVSPQNVMISYEGEVKLTDFGIAKAATRLSKTQPGILKGKFHYMSPEQARAGHLDARSDLFSLGSILYELLVQDRLFKAPSNVELLKKVRAAEIVPPSQKNAAIDKELDAILLKALAADPDDRFQSAYEFRQAINHYMHAHFADYSPNRLASMMHDLFQQSDTSIAPTTPSQPSAQESSSSSFRMIELEGVDNIEPLQVDKPVPASSDDATRAFELGSIPDFSAVRDQATVTQHIKQSVSKPADQPAHAPLADMPEMSEALKIQSGPHKAPTASGSTWGLRFLGIAAVCLASAGFALMLYQNFFGDSNVLPVSQLVLQGSQEAVQVTLNGELHSQQLPFTFKELKPDKAYSIEVTKAGHVPFRQQLTLEVGQTIKIAVKLHAYGTAKINSTPPGAILSLNGKVQGTTPLTLNELNPDQIYSLVLSHEKAHTWQGTLQVLPGQESIKNVRLNKAQGHLAVSSTPAGALVYIDKRRYGTTPMRLDDLNPGRYQLELYKEGYRSNPQTITLTKSPLDLNIRLRRLSEKQVGYLTLRSTPSGARILLDGKDIAKKTPVKAYRLGTGSYSIGLQQAGYEDATIRVSVGSNEAMSRRVTMKEISKVEVVEQSHLNKIQHKAEEICIRFIPKPTLCLKAVAFVAAHSADYYWAFLGVLVFLALLALIVIFKLLAGMLRRLKMRRKEDPYLKGDLLLQKGQLKAALKVFRTAGIYDRTAQVYIRLGDLEKAALMYEKAGDAFEAAKLYDRLGSSKQAAELYLKCDRLPEAAKAFEAAGNERQAADFYEQAGQHHAALRLYQKLGNYKRALQLSDHLMQQEMSKDIMALNDDQRESVRKLAFSGAAAAIMLKRPEKAVLFFEQLEDLYFPHAKHHKDMRNLLEQLQSLSHVMQAGGQVENDQQYLGRSWSDWAEWFEQANFHVVAAQCYRHAGNMQKAGALLHARGLSKLAAPMLTQGSDFETAAALYEESGDLEKALRLYVQAGNAIKQAQLSEKLGRFFAAGVLFAESGMDDDAIACLQKVSAAKSDVVNYFKATSVLVDIFMRKDMLSLAQKRLEDIMSNYPVQSTNLELYYQLATTIEAKYPERSSTIYESILGIDFQFKDVAKRLQQTKQQVEDQKTRVQPAGGMHVTLKRKYTMHEKIAEGGMGAVYRAEDIILKRPVAIKVLHANLKDLDHVRSNFLREAQSIATLNHPNIVQLYSVEPEDDGTFYMVMEYIEGQTLRQFFRQHEQGLPIQQGLSIMHKMCDGLEYAHARKIVHRDISANNIMLTNDGEVKLMDFGLAKLIDQAKTDQSIIAGTPLYIAPEQFLGDPIDWRSDIYSAGVVCFEGITGHHPFKSEKASKVEQFISVPPKDPKALRPDLPDEVCQFLLRCVEKDIEKRYQSVTALKQDLVEIEDLIFSKTEKTDQTMIDPLA